MALADLLAVGVPLNRKERFFTGTVFPQIVCADGGAHFERFLHLLGLGDLPVSWALETTNIQFFTEYSLVESIFTEEDKVRFPDPPAEKFTPDIVILITGESPRLIALEAKMYDRPSRAELQLQMQRQSTLLQYLASCLGLPEGAVVHAALLPGGLVDELGGMLPFNVVTWEELRARFLEGRDEDYFLALLGLALERWPSLTSSSWAPGTEPDDVLRGSQIVARYGAGQLRNAFVGRTGGLDGAAFAKDIEGGWSERPYPLKKAGQPPNPNWFPVADFVARIG